MLRTRVISGIVLGAVSIVTIGMGGYLLYIPLLIIAIIGMFEFYRAMGVQGETVTLLEGCGYLSAILYFVAMRLDFERYGMLTMLLCLLAILAVYVISYPGYQIAQVMTVFFGFVYVAVFLSFIYLLRELPGGLVFELLLFFSSWGSDTCAYFAGMRFGKHHMTPELSPKKTWEGALGGLAGAAVLGGITALVTRAPLLSFILVSLLCSIVSMIGDLAASAVKRNVGIKDYGNLIPGHGGILDRFDSVIFVAPFLYVLVTVII
ncbi:MAG: phosphatidate cytidylyltransferase [Blautia sp.]|nr:phosphatidate cytidylyltransferase [Blautia sp.]